MIVYYRFAGLLADLALLLNVAVHAGRACRVRGDAHAARHRRHRAHARHGRGRQRAHQRAHPRGAARSARRARAAVEAGYDRALPSILDSNITTLLSGLILFQFGSGPIRGFAVTLCIGLVIHVFTAVFCTRVAWDYLLARRRMQTVSI